MKIVVFARKVGKSHISVDKFYTGREKNRKEDFKFIIAIKITSGDVRYNNCTSRCIAHAVRKRLMNNDELASHFSV